MTFDASNPVPTAPAWQVSLWRDNGEAFECGKRLGAQGRGSQARYRRAVVDAIDEWEHNAEAHHAIGQDSFDAGDAEDVVQQARYSAMYDRAARRARALLERLDAGGR